MKIIQVWYMKTLFMCLSIFPWIYSFRYLVVAGKHYESIKVYVYKFISPVSQGIHVQLELKQNLVLIIIPNNYKIITSLTHLFHITNINGSWGLLCLWKKISLLTHCTSKFHFYTHSTHHTRGYRNRKLASNGLRSFPWCSGYRYWVRSTLPEMFHRETFLK